MIAGRASIALLVALVVVHPCSALYHSSSELLHWFSHTAARHPSILRFEELKDKQHGHTFLPVATITADADARPAKQKPVVLFVFGEHARELITSEVGIWLARLLTDAHSAIYAWPEFAEALQRSGANASNAASSSSGSGSAPDWPAVVRRWVAEVLQVLEVQLIPIESLDSRRQVEQGELCVRKTASNVDLNRNWPYAWQRVPAGDEQYGGPGPFSEPQSRLVKRLVDGLPGRLLGYVNVHSGEWALYTPWDSKPGYAPGLPADLPALVETVGRLCDCIAGPAGAVSGYLAFGSSMDYLYVHKRVPYPLTVEVFGGDGAGKLQQGQRNKPLGAYDLLQDSKPAAPTGAAGAQQPVIAADAPIPRRVLLGGQQQQQQQQQQQRQDKQLQRWWLHWRLWQWRWPAAAAAGAAAADGVAAARRRSLLQLTAEQQAQLAGGGPVAAVSAAPGGDAAGGGGTSSSGGSDDVMDVVHSAAPHLQSCFRAFNPEGEQEYRRVVADWVAAFVLMLRHMARSDAMARVAQALEAERG